jgi:predicted DNA-binding transcriptional regulator AlpA
MVKGEGLLYTEGVYTYLCGKCETLFAVVSRFSVKSDGLQALECPKCRCTSQLTGEGYIVHKNKEPISNSNGQQMNEIQSPELLSAPDIAKFLGVSKGVAYELMGSEGFPLIRIRRSKRVLKKEFLKWIENQRH